MNLLDLIVVLLVAIAALHGFVLGAAAQVITFAGLWAGLAAAVALAPHVRNLSTDSTTRLGLVIATMVVVPLVVTVLARTLGVHAWRAIQRGRLTRVDAAAGVVVAAVATLLAAWLLGTMLSGLPNAKITTEIEQSAILRAVDAVMPAPPAVFARIGRLLDPLGFPDVFAQFEPTPAGGLPVASASTVRTAVARAGASVVKIEGTGCGGVQDGSGFVVWADLVVTNAHVVAGIAHPFVVDAAGRHRATPVLFDAKLDVAVLEASNLRGPALDLSGTTVTRGTEAVVMGYPGGGPFKAVGAAILARTEAVGRDIYGRNLTARSIYQLQAVVRPGNSGGPLVGADGSVVGVVFARSTSNPDVGFALTSDEVAVRIRSTLQHPQATGTGACAA